MKRNKENIFIHALRMIKYNKKNYILLSVTVILTFSFMLCFLLFQDSNLYNKYKYIDGADKEIIISSLNMENNKTEVKMLINQLDKIENCYYNIVPSYTVDNNANYSYTLKFINNNSWFLYDNSHIVIKRRKVCGEYNYNLNKNEAIVPKYVYDRLPKDSNGDITLELDVPTGKKGFHPLTNFKVVGHYDDENLNTINIQEYEQRTEQLGDIYVNCDLGDLTLANTDIIIHYNDPPRIINLLKNLSLPCVSDFENYEEAQVEKNSRVQNKYIIALALFIILGINLYSSFENALSERKYEIGVKRALGAGKINILFQFLIEATNVMIINILISIIISINAILGYKLYEKYINHTEYVIQLSNQSMILYGILAAFLTIIFSLFFAYKSTQVEIIKYLKEE